MKRGIKPLPWDLPPEYLGREHFMEFGKFKPELDVKRAQMVFARLTARAIFPNDNRYVDYCSHGLTVAARILVNLPPIPEWAEIERSSQNKRQEQYAVGTISLIDSYDRVFLQQSLTLTVPA